MNAENAIAALRAAADSLECGDSASALDYAAVACAEIRSGERLRPGAGLLFLTADAIECVRLGVTDLPFDPDPETRGEVEELSGSDARRMAEAAPPAAPRVKLCGSRSLSGPSAPLGWVCTRPAGHADDHVAHVFTSDGPRAVATWEREAAR